MGSRLFVVFFTAVLDLIGFGIIIPLLPLYAESYGASGTEIGLLFAAYSLMNFLFAPVWGRLSDRIGRRPVMLGSIAGNALAMVAFALAPNYAMLLIARLFAGLCSANISVANAYVADITPVEQRARGMGMIGAAFGIGFVIGPALGGELSHFGYAAPALAAAGLAGLNWVSAFFFLPESLTPERRTAALSHPARRFDLLLAGGALALVLVLVFMHVAAFSMMETSIVLFANRRFDFGVRECGRVFAFVGVLMVLVQGGLIGRLARRFGEVKLVISGMLLVALGLGLLPFTPGGQWPLLLVFMALLAVGQGLVGPSLQTLVSKRSPAHKQGQALGLSQSISALARVVGPAIAGVLLDVGSENTPLLAASFGMLLALLLAGTTLSAVPSRTGPEAT